MPVLFKVKVVIYVGRDFDVLLSLSLKSWHLPKNIKVEQAEKAEN